MKLIVAFDVLGEPVGKARPRILKNGMHYTPVKTRTYQQKVALEALKARGIHETPFGCAVRVDILALFKVPVSLSKKERAARLNGFHTMKPDADNLIKIVMDALNGVLFYDDKQVAVVSARKQYAHLVPQIQVTVRALGEDDLWQQESGHSR